MPKKDKKPTFTNVTTKSGETLKVFDDLDTFETFIKNETEDDDFSDLHCQVNYLPPFVLHQAHDDPDKVKDTENSHNKKFVRHLHQHVEKHLLKDLKQALNLPDMKFHEKSKDEQFDKITWHYAEETEYHDKKFKVIVEVTCHHDDALVNVDYRTVPL
ncbi:Rgi1p KNAG_0L01550 [Huiozyma naganishii CBS 8797]|uniref:Respiratory growth induced protein 1 n=1 Tax=Huiozyma naganishii (strain ATCC MYA-139 / BCRC 22969 / CBS 8797 / KCTC 17520 / NBRC 10181 / NCYC 3082 / Yp74L-3) TaxID=1071383 RepID=J7RD13_HUIN7|nr:hypothetical protein KNAG_0L01550 [Kazachstania naganishii CBS 8797]CCK72775.1 hypothetical protein KNAG_0L01550 [Kazachstania naganishii CBS 8797]